MPAYERRDLSQGAPDPEILLAGDITSGSTSINISGATGWPTGSVGPFFIVINRDQSTEEKILCSSRSTNTLTVAGGAAGRGLDGTSAAAHTTGEPVEITYTARDFDEANYTTAETVGKVTAAGQLLVSDAANSFASLDANDSGKILVGNGTTLVSVAMSGDATIDAAGAVTVASTIARDSETTAAIAALSALLCPPGTYRVSAETSPGSGWLLCNGQVVSRTTYADLFAILSTTYNTGGEAGTDFRLPDGRGRTLIGAGTGSGLTARTLGQQTIGAETHTLSAAESGIAAHNHTATDAGHTHTTPNHTHTVTDPGHTHATTDSITAAVDPFGVAAAGTVVGHGVGFDTSSSNTTGITNQNAAPTTNSGTASITVANASATAAANAHANMQPSMVANLFIKT